jgi:hypothetical protein
MKRYAIALLLTLPLAAADTDSIDTVTRAVYDTISGPAGPRNWDRFRALFIEGGRLINFRNTPQGPALNVMTPDDFAKRAGANTTSNGFFESEVSRRVETFGNIAHVFSTYESRRAPADKPFARGINSFQLAKEGNAWKVVTILWDAEREGNPLPEKYQPQAHHAEPPGLL